MTTEQPSNLGNAIAQARPPEQRTAADLVNSMKGEFAKALPAHVTIDRFLRLALTELRMNSLLGNASAESLLGGLMTAARLGLDVGGPTGHFYLTPRRIKGDWSVVPIVGYRGLIELARRAGVGQVNAQLVRDGDHFAEGFDNERGFYAEWQPMTGGGNDRSVIGVLAAARLENGDVQHRYLTIDEVMDRKARGAAGDKGPWATDLDAMIRKTGIRALVPMLPQSTDLAYAAQVDETPQTWRPGDIAPTPALETAD